MRDLTAPEQVSALEDGSIHAGILRPPIPSDALMSERLFSESLVVAFPRGHRFADYQRVPWGALADQPYVLFSRRRAPAYQAVVARACRDAGVTLKVKYEVENPQSVLAVVAAGVGISLVPGSLQRLKRPGIKYRRLTPSGPALETVIAWHREREEPFVQAFVSVARAIARSRSFVA